MVTVCLHLVFSFFQLYQLVLCQFTDVCFILNSSMSTLESILSVVTSLGKLFNMSLRKLRGFHVM